MAIPTFQAKLSEQIKMVNYGAAVSFRKQILQCKFILEPTATDVPSQNGLAERPNQTLGAMTRCILHAASLGSEYWSFALVHAAHLKNHLLHQAISGTSYERYTGHWPSEILAHFWIPAWNASWYKILDQCRDKGRFGQLMQKLHDVTALYMLWTY
jgi:hypothetical protein